MLRDESSGLGSWLMAGYHHRSHQMGTKPEEHLKTRWSGHSFSEAPSGLLTDDLNCLNYSDRFTILLLLPTLFYFSAFLPPTISSSSASSSSST
ncbi:hypothetical protein POX_b03090 [Penicillium oxalicum]|uniref:Uncharacterized protein n=1 Tax=Penicillium oxalicum (strain 114-2 / CGMCC 5302) TaxID=933388 RepID=S7ZMJ2_PENO1|nr:hypothetical protein POX_b03090 [Penicillium oxalicum]EPS29886.1 hypothetical protein PDE_04836 [Penicillium oxalicum 114-2]KAI2793043.1 hypothetical protein POX_b03090 [Penicillium oxalicum]